MKAMEHNKNFAKCLITGAAGFIGSHLAKRLLDEGRRVILVDDFSRGDRQNLADLGIQTVCHDINLRNYNGLSSLMEGVDTVFHLAARVGSVDYLHGDDEAELITMENNLVIDANVFKACLEKKVKKIVYASSISVYPVAAQRFHNAVFSEDNIKPLSPEGGYGWAKLMAEIELGLMKGVNVGIARIFNIYGENAALGRTAQIIPALITKVIGYPDQDYVVWGDGQQTRDFLYVSDCVEGLCRLEEKASNPPLIVNIGSGKTVAISTIAEKIARISGKNPTIKYDTSKPVGPVSRTSDITRARETLGWQPQIDLDDGLTRTYDWLEKRLSRKQVILNGFNGKIHTVQTGSIR
jgi:GDP-D-mannose 3',5'-epimerase